MIGSRYSSRSDGELLQKKQHRLQPAGHSRSWESCFKGPPRVAKGHLTPLSPSGLKDAEMSSSLDNESDTSGKRPDLSPMKKLPQWLLEFGSFSLAVNDKFDPSSTRPFTESCTQKTPQWYQELVQTRRHSEEIGLEMMPPEDPDPDPTPDSSSQTKSKLSPDFISIFSEAEDRDADHQHIPKTGRRASKFLHTPEQEASLEYSANTCRGKSSCSSSCSPSDEEVPFPSSMFTRTIHRSPVGNRRGSVQAKDLDIVDLELESESSFDFNSDFIIPELPSGRELVLEIKTNWGDVDFVGLNGIEIFDAKTNDTARIDKIWCELESSPAVRALVVPPYRTHDDNNIWTTTFIPSSPIRVHITFKETISIVLLRIWNYNKSRIYSSRGVRDILISLDETPVFKGEIAKAYGELRGSPDKFGDTILYTTDERILESISKNDISFQELLADLT